MNNKAEKFLVSGVDDALSDVCDDYDPHQERDVSKPTSTIGTFIHVMKGAMGIGILALPSAFKNGGLVFGVLGVCFLGMLYAHCVHMLINVSYEVCKRDRVPILGFGETFKQTCSKGPPRLQRMGKILRHIVDGYLMIPRASTIYMIFIGTTLHEVVNSKTDLEWDIRVYILLATIPAIAITQVREIKYLVPFSAIAAFLIFVNVVISLYYIFKEPLSFEGRRLFPDYDTITSFVGSAYFAFDATSLIFPVYNKMKRPQHYLGCPGIVNLNNLCLALLYSFFGFVGYARYGDAIEGSITLNFPNDDTLAVVIQIVSAVAILFSIGIFFYVPCEIIWGKIRDSIPTQWHGVGESMMRFVFLMMIVGIACAIPELKTFINLIGAVLNPFLALWAPIIIDTVYRWPNQFGWMRWRLVKNTLLAAFGLALMITGTITGVNDIVDIYKE